MATTVRKKQSRKKKDNIRNKLFRIAVVLISFIILASIAIVIIETFSDSWDDFEKMQYPTKYEEIVQEMSEKYDVSDELIYAVIRTESSFDEEAGSSAGALGLMQIIPDTFDWLQMYYHGEVTMETEMLFEPEINIEYGTMFLSFLLDRYTEETSCIAAYNAGFGAVDDWLLDDEYSKDGEKLSYIPYPETENYVAKVVNAKIKYKDLYGI